MEEIRESTATADPEIAAMLEISRTLEALDQSQRTRVLRWVTDKHSLSERSIDSRTPPLTPVGDRPGAFRDIAELFDAANPQTRSEKVLVASYFFHQIQGQTDIDAHQVNTQLKQLGHGVENITGAFTDLMERKPRLVIQIRKSGNTRQARKRYRLTLEGVRRVQEMSQGLKGSAGGTDGDQ